MRIPRSYRRFGHGAILLVVLWIACAKPEPSIRPGVNDEYKTTDVDEWVGRFESESREIFRERQRIMQAAGVRAGMVVADVGAGSGFFTEMFAREVGEKGRVFAADITPEFLKRIEEKTQRQRLSNVTTVLSTERDSKLPANTVDLVFICDTYHHFEYPKSTLASIRRAMKPGGMLVVVDFDRVPGKSRPWVLDHVRAGKEVVRSEIEEAHFRLVDEPATPFLTENYVLRFRKWPRGRGKN